MNFIVRTISNPRLIVPMGIVLALGFLLIDAAVDSLFFDQERQGFVENLLEPEPMDRWMRLVVTIFVVGFAFYARHLLKREIGIADELARERNLLADRVAAATRGLQEKNATLEREIEARRRVESELQALAITDPLTQLYNRRKLLLELDAGIASNRRYRTGLSLILCDIDHFKRINDTYGHDAGDAALRRFAEIIRRNTRESDTVARWGGEEFALLMPAADDEKAFAIAEKLREAVAQSAFDGIKTMTASFGVAVLGIDDSAESLIKRADQALYAAKAAGRNVVMPAGERRQD